MEGGHRPPIASEREKACHYEDAQSTRYFGPGRLLRRRVRPGKHGPGGHGRPGRDRLARLRFGRRRAGRAPPEVQALHAGLASEVERVLASEESARLRDAYLAASVVGPSSGADAHHVALATVCRANLIVSWNFKHIVHVGKIRLFNAVNLMEGYPPIDIRSPRRWFR